MIGLGIKKKLMIKKKINKPFVFVIFGASGDLAKLKIFPALYDLMNRNKLPNEFYILGYARTKMTRSEFQNIFRESIKYDVDEKVLDKLLNKVYYFSGQYDDMDDFMMFRRDLKKITKNQRNLTKLAYFSVPPFVFKGIIKNLGESSKNKNANWRLIIEKPFGEDTRSADALYHFVVRYFSEKQVYLLDHYLGKQSVQSLLHLRHYNRILNSMMKGREVSNIQITAFEQVGVEDRIGYFDQVGMIKDMIQSHLLQILALITMSIPISEDEGSIHQEKYNILSALKFPKHKNNIILGQYKTYKKLKDVNNKSKTETFAALRLFIDRESWYKVPIYIRTGKRLNKKMNIVVVEMKKFPFQSKKETPNRLIFQLQPEARLIIKLINKYNEVPDYHELSPCDTLTAKPLKDLPPEHSNLILDVLRGEKSNFLSFPEIIASWKLTDSIISFINKNRLRPEIYDDCSCGPKNQHDLTNIDGFKWIDLNECK